MHSRAIFILDSNEFRATGYATLLMPGACRSESDLHVATSLGDIGDLSGYDSLACIFCVGGLSLRDHEVARTLAGLQEIFGHHPLIVLSDLSDRQEIVAALEAGLRGFLPTSTPSHVALAAIQFILAGGTYLPHSLEASRGNAPAAAPPAPVSHLGTRRLTRLAGQPEIPPEAKPERLAAAEAPRPAACGAAAGEPLRPRHVEVLAGLSQGQTNKVIARHLNLTEATVKLYVRQLMKIFHAENRTQLALKASGHPQIENPARPDTSARNSPDRTNWPSSFRPDLRA